MARRRSIRSGPCSCMPHKVWFVIYNQFLACETQNNDTKMKNGQKLWLYGSFFPGFSRKMTQRWKTVKNWHFESFFEGVCRLLDPILRLHCTNIGILSSFFTPRHAPEGAICDFWPISSMWDPEKWPKDEKRWKKWLLGSIFSGVGRLWTPFLGLKCARMTPDMEGR